MDWLNGFTTGELQVTPYTICNGGLSYAATQSLNIQLNPLPNIDAGPDTTFNCFRDTVILVAQSTDVITAWQWEDPFGTTVSNDSLEINSNIPGPGQYIATVTDPMGCQNQDTVWVTMDTAKPDVILTPGPYWLSCIIDTVEITGSSSVSGVSIDWRDGANMIYPNPLEATVIGPYTCRVTNPVNGCADSTGILVSLNDSLPDIEIIGHPGYVPTTFIDTITCIKDTIVLDNQAGNNANVYWTDASYTSNNGNSLEITEAGTYRIFGVHNSSGCEDSLQVLVTDFLTVPNVTLTGDTSFTCSNDSVTLVINSVFSNVEYFWNGIPEDTLMTGTAGYHVYEVFLLDNGCSTIDSIEVLFQPLINVDIGNDTVVCEGAIVPVTAHYQGNINGIIYSWNDGSSTSTALFEGGIDTVVYVDVSGDNGCLGSDTLRISIPDAPTTTFDVFAPCGGNNGQIIVQTTGGVPPFEYSLDGTNFQTSNIFTGLSLGNHLVTVRDSLDCNYDFSTAITDTTSQPDIDFLMPTYNQLEDTIVMVDVSVASADSVSWTIPAPLFILDSSVVSPVVIATDTGVFNIQMHAHIGTCEFTVEKALHISEVDSTIATFYNDHGIKNITLFPNPNSGSFTVNVEFYRQQSAYLSVVGAAGVEYHSASFGETLSISEFIDLTSSNPVNGTYVLKLVSEFDSAYITFVIAN